MPSSSSSSAVVVCDRTKRLHHTLDSMPRVCMGRELNTDHSVHCGVIDDVLPEAMLMEILSRLPDARDLARCAAVNKSFLASFSHVNTVRLLCKLQSVRGGHSIPFKETVLSTLKQLSSVATLRLEIEDEMQASRFKEEGTGRDILWLSEKTFIQRWLPPVMNTLRNLTVIDYGQQAIFRATPLLQMLSTHCKQLQTIELRNMNLDCKDVEKMNKVTTMTLRCVKLTENGLREINKCMPQLETLTLVTVVGLKNAVFESDKLKVLCLGLAMRVKLVKLVVTHLKKLQLKMACPDHLTVKAPDLQCLAVCMDKRDGTTVQFDNVRNLKELLMGASEFITLNTLCSSNAGLEKAFLDVPCMGFEETGAWKGVVAGVPLGVPDMDAIRSCCPKLHTLSVGPGLWHALEDSWKPGTEVPKWPSLRRFILHMIVQDSDKSMALLAALVRVMMPTLSILEVYVHTDSNAEAKTFDQLQTEFPLLDLKCDSWKKGLKFDCFSF